jgi:hypothetical protein
MPNRETKIKEVTQKEGGNNMRRNRGGAVERQKERHCCEMTHFKSKCLGEKMKKQSSCLRF